MIRTAILAAMLLVMLSMAYSRTGQLPDLRTAQEPAKIEPKTEPQVAALSEPVAPPSPRTHITERPGIDPASPMTPIRATIARTRAAAPPPAEIAAAPTPEAPLAPATVVAAQPEPVAMPLPAPVAVAQPAPVVVPQPTRPAPVAAAPIVAKVASALVEPTAPKVEEPPAEPVAAVPPEPVVAKITPVDEMPVKQVATPRVMMPRDLPLPSEPPVAKIAPRTVAANDVMDDGFPAPPPGSTMGANVAPTPSTAAAKKPADAPQLMSREERTRELYRLAREMEDTFISKLAR